MSEQIIPKEAERLIQVSDEELLLMLSAAQLDGELFSLKGRMQEGRAIFQAALSAYRPQICDFWMRNKENLPELAAVVAGLATALSTAAAAVTVPLTPFSVLVVRYGFRRLCEEAANGKGT